MVKDYLFIFGIHARIDRKLILDACFDIVISSYCIFNIGCGVQKDYLFNIKLIGIIYLLINTLSTFV